MLSRHLLRGIVGIAAAVSAATAASVASGSPASALGGDPSYVVQIHSTREGFLPPPEGKDPSSAKPLRMQPMTTASGQRFECYIPTTPAGFTPVTESQQLEDDEAAGQRATAFARAAAKRIRPMCVQFVDDRTHRVYEVCPGSILRRVTINEEAFTAPPPTEEETARAMATMTAPPGTPVHRVDDVAVFKNDGFEPPLSFGVYTNDLVRDRMLRQTKSLYTQYFRDPDVLNAITKVQFVCSAKVRDDLVAAVAWPEDQEPVDPKAFLVASRVFCDASHGNGEDGEKAFSVGSLLRPLAEQHACIKRNEGWWTYEFCFGRGIRQYHRESDGRITAEFSLGAFDEAKNVALEAKGGALVSEYIDATHDVSRPAFLEWYTGGTHCKEFDVSTPRKSKVYFYCSQGGSNHHILSVKETQTCTYTIKISSPVVCDHPHFISQEQKSDDKAEIVHCIPVDSAIDEEKTPSAPVTTSKEPIREVAVSAVP